VNLLGPFVVLVVAWLAFRFGLRQDERRSTREQRAAVYVDILVEASAQGDVAKDKMARAEILAAGGDPKDDRFSPLPDDRLGSGDRRRLAARAHAWASRETILRWNRLENYEFNSRLKRTSVPQFHVEHSALLESLQHQIRHEFNLDRTSWWRRLNIKTVAVDAYADQQARFRKTN
jgi:hypothetical protein